MATWSRSRHALKRSMALLILVALAASGCREDDSPSGPIPEWMEEGSGVLRVLRAQGIETCRGLVAYSSPGSGSRRAILEGIARELGADSSDPDDIAALVGRDLAGRNAPAAPVEAGAEGCLLGLRQGLEAWGP